MTIESINPKPAPPREAPTHHFIAPTGTKFSTPAISPAHDASPELIMELVTSHNEF